MTDSELSVLHDFAMWLFKDESLRLCYWQPAQFASEVLCSACNGLGVYGGTKTCIKCKGFGVVVQDIPGGLRILEPGAPVAVLTAKVLSAYLSHLNGTDPALIPSVKIKASSDWEALGETVEKMAAAYQEHVNDLTAHFSGGAFPESTVEQELAKAKIKDILKKISDKFPLDGSDAQAKAWIKDALGPLLAEQDVNALVLNEGVATSTSDEE